MGTRNQNNFPTRFPFKRGFTTLKSPLRTFLSHMLIYDTFHFNEVHVPSPFLLRRRHRSSTPITVGRHIKVNHLQTLRCSTRSYCEFSTKNCRREFYSPHPLSVCLPLRRGICIFITIVVVINSVFRRTRGTGQKESVTNDGPT